MKISPFISLRPQIQTNKNQKTLNASYPVIKDSVSFTSASKLNMCANEATKYATRFGTDVCEKLKTDELDLGQLSKLAKNFISEIPELKEKFVNKAFPKLKIDTMKNLPEAVKEIQKLELLAYLLPSYGADCNLDEVTIFIPSEKMNTQAIGSLVHEYTHAIQRMKDDDYMGLALLTDRDLFKTRALNSFSSTVFSAIESIKRDGAFVNSLLKGLDVGLSDKDAMCYALGCRNLKEAKRLFRGAFFNDCFQNTKNEFLADPEVLEYIPLINKPDKLKEITRQQCKLRAKMEFEAYTAQKNFLNQTGSCKKENIFNPVLYKMIYELLD